MVQPSSVRCMALGTRPDSHKERKAYATQRKYYGSAIECRLHGPRHKAGHRHKAGFSQGGKTA